MRLGEAGRHFEWARNLQTRVHTLMKANTQTGAQTHTCKTYARTLPVSLSIIPLPSPHSSALHISIPPPVDCRGPDTLPVPTPSSLAHVTSATTHNGHGLVVLGMANWKRGERRRRGRRERGPTSTSWAPSGPPAGSWDSLFSPLPMLRMRLSFSSTFVLRSSTVLRMRCGQMVAGPWGVRWVVALGIPTWRGAGGQGEAEGDVGEAHTRRRYRDLRAHACRKQSGRVLSLRQSVEQARGIFANEEGQLSGGGQAVEPGRRARGKGQLQG
jgi:hypothetical protein